MNFDSDTQRDRFCWSGENAVAADHIGFYERFEEACGTPATALKIKTLAAPRRLNAGDAAPVDYARAFRDVRDMMRERYRADFDAFQYSDDPADALAPPGA